jgi:hypothetical protein
MTRGDTCRMAREMLERGDLAEAEAAFGRAVDHGHAPTEALRGRAACRARREDWGAAADDLERALKAETGEPSPLDVEHARVLRLASSLPAEQAARLVKDFGFEAMEKAVSLRVAGAILTLDDVASRAATLAERKYAPAPLEPLRNYLSAKIPGRLYRVPPLQALSPIDIWPRCEKWVFCGLGAADVLHEAMTGHDASSEPAAVPKPPYARGTEIHQLAERCPVNWPFVHHALLVMAYDLAQELADAFPAIGPELPAVRDGAVKPLVFLGFGIGLESQGM